MILEVVDARTGEVRVRVRLDALPFTLGRGYDNDLVLDDPYLDVHHARITGDDAGLVVVRDLGTVNGLVVSGTTERRPSVVVGHGTELRAGHTILRFRDPAQPLPPALRHEADAVRHATDSPWWATTWGKAAAPAVAAVAFGLTYWFDSFERTGGAEALGVAFVFLLVGAVWAGVWAVAGRVAVHRFQFLPHLAVVSATSLVIVVLALASEWVAFVFPDNPVVGPIEAAIALVLVAALVAGHLALASSLNRMQRWRAGAIVSIVLITVGSLVLLAEPESFTDVPEFSAVLKPFPARALPAGTIEGFARVAEDLRAEVDELAAHE